MSSSGDSRRIPSAPWRAAVRGGLLSGMKTIPILPLNPEVFGTFPGHDRKPHQADRGSEGLLAVARGGRERRRRKLGDRNRGRDGGELHAEAGRCRQDAQGAGDVHRRPRYGGECHERGDRERCGAGAGRAAGTRGGDQRPPGLDAGGPAGRDRAVHDSFPGIELKLRAADRPQGIRLLTEGASDLHCGGIDAGEPLPPFLRRDSFVEVEAGIVARKDHPLHARRAGLEDLAGWPWVDYDGAAPADSDAGSRASLFGVLHDLHERTGRRAGTVIRAGPAGPFPMASGPYLAWLPLKFLHAFDPDLRPLPVSFGRHRYRTGFIARRSAEDLASFRLLRQAVRDAALEKSGRPPG